MINNTTRNAVDSYNDDLAEVLHQALTGDRPWQHNTPRVTMRDFLDSLNVEVNVVLSVNDNEEDQLSFNF